MNTYRIVPVNTWFGYTAPALYVNASKYDEALKEAAKRCTLTTRFPDVWKLV